MHVLVTADTVGGVWTYARELVTGLVRRGVRVTLVSFGDIPNRAQMAWLKACGTSTSAPRAFDWSGCRIGATTSLPLPSIC